LLKYVGKIEQTRTKRGEPEGVLSFPLAFENLLGELQLKLIIGGATGKIINPKQHFSKVRPVDPAKFLAASIW
jgi:hypothetical protein